MDFNSKMKRYKILVPLKSFDFISVQIQMYAFFLNSNKVICIESLAVALALSVLQQIIIIQFLYFIRLVLGNEVEYIFTIQS